MQQSITHITFSGGGLTGISYLGVIQYIVMEKLDKQIKHVSGTSIGSIMAAIFCMGIWDFDKYIRTYIPTIFISRSQILEIFTKNGFIDTQIIIEPLITAMTQYGYDKHITFLQLAKQTGKILLIPASCIDTTSVTYFSVDTTPNVEILDAIRASCAIPLIFQPVKIGSEFYVDGVLTNNTPLPNDDKTNNNHIQNTLIIIVNHIRESQTQYVNDSESYSLFTYCLRLLMFMIPKKIFTDYSNILEFTNISTGINAIPVIFEKDGIRIHLTNEEIDKAIVEGIEKTHDWFMLMQKDSLHEQEDPSQYDPHHIQLDLNQPK